MIYTAIEFDGFEVGPGSWGSGSLASMLVPHDPPDLGSPIEIELWREDIERLIEVLQEALQ